MPPVRFVPEADIKSAEARGASDPISPANINELTRYPFHFGLETAKAKLSEAYVHAVFAVPKPEFAATEGANRR